MRPKAKFLFVVFLGLFAWDCSSNPATPTKNNTDKTYEYRYNVVVTYTRPDSAVLKPDSEDAVQADPFLVDPSAPGGFTGGGIWMTKTGPNTYQCTLPKVYVNPAGYRHRMDISDLKRISYAEEVAVEGAYDLGAQTMSYGTSLLFRMSK